MKIKIWLLFVFLSVVFVTGFLNCSKDPIEPPPIEPPSQWSEPVLYYSNPDAFSLKRFAADVNLGTLNVVSSFDLFSKGINYSAIYSLQQEPGKELVKKMLSQENIPSGWPSVLRDHSGDLHFLWGDRRQDPEFEKWDVNREKGLIFSTDVVYFNFDKDRPEHIYAGNLLDGSGSVYFPIHLVADNQGNLHGVINTAKLLNDIDGNPTEFGMFWLVYVSKSKNGQWTSKYLHDGVGPGLVSLARNRIVIVYRGIDFNNPTLGRNDLMITCSDDGGVSWSDPVSVLMPGGQDMRSLNLIKESEEKLHIIIGRGKQGVVTHEEIWHVVSYDGGISWSEQEIITNHPLMIFETIIDPYGNLHLMGIDYPDFSIWYSSMSPKTGQWEDLTKLDFADEAGWISLTFDEAENELYLFWKGVLPEKHVIYYSNKSVKSPL